MYEGLEGLEPDFEEMYDDLDPYFEEMCDDVEPNFDAMNDGVEPVMIDLTDVFTTGMIFETATARPRTKTKLILGCERSGKYRPWKNPNLTRSTWTRKCDCPFRLRGTRSNVDDGWYLHVICGLHNHKLAKKLTSHSFLGRLSQDEKNVLGDMTKNFVKPKNILMTLMDHNVESLTTKKQVYNARQAYRSSLRGNRTEMQHLLTLMERDKYVYRYRKVEGSDELRDIF
ncbi:uncharacterized protein [Cicer arietinum]|uniref:Uncharacterized protein LOC101505858 n=1 Tax=Cicer arietinum TaxID=3827 RepID=A0A1S2Z4W1_CICAR|nr:uncharacterized protein LOC101505858 [Cicer arietinum]